MFDLPKTSEIRKPLHKKLIYEKYAAELTGNKKDRFDTDIRGIFNICSSGGTENERV